MVDWARQFWGDGLPEESYDKARAALSDPDNKWVRYIDRVLDETDPHVARVTALNLGFEAFLRGTRSIRKNRELYQCNIPWLILFDPTSACNMHCEGCWAGTYGGRSNLSFEDMDKILTQGKELGVYLYMLTGGEPLVRKADIIRLAEKHSDAEFAIYTNSTLIDEAFCNQLTERLAACREFDEVIYLEGRHIEHQTPQRYLGLWESVNDVRVQLGEEKFAAFLAYVREKTAELHDIEAEYLTRAWIARRAK